jgi:hypothetical protein
MKLYHGSEVPVEKPLYKFGKTSNDYGQGFYCSNDEELAKEWACRRNIDGYVNEYELETDKLKILNLLDEKYNILNWIALLLKNRSFLVNDSLSIHAKEYIISNFYIDISDYDIVIGYRADDSYFAYAQSFINNSLSLESLNKALRLGNLGIQIVLISEKAFKCIKYISSNQIDSKIYNKKYVSRDRKARNDYKELLVNDVLESMYIVDIIRKEIKNDDPSLRRIISK